VVSALNYLTGEGISYYPDGCDHGAIEALIEDYFDGSDESDDDMKGFLELINHITLPYSISRVTRW